MKKKTDAVWIIIGIIGFILLINNTGFLGSLVTTCVNNEPRSLAEFQTSLLDNDNATYAQSGVLGIEIDENTSYFYTKYVSVSLLGEIQLAQPLNMSCPDFTELMRANTPNASIFYLEGHKVINLPGEGYLWCNKNNNVALMATSTSIIQSYYAAFETCTTEEVNDEPDNQTTSTTTTTTTTDNNKENGETCTESTECADGLLCLGQVCAEPVIAEPDTNYDTRLWVSILAAVALLLALYFMFEKGPDKGFFRGKRRKKK